MLKKLKFAAVALLLPMIAFAQSYPSPTFQNLTVNGTFTSTGNIGLSSLAAQAANTILANATGSSASPTAIPMAGCNGAAQALQYTNGAGASAFTCNSNIATNGANANITSLTGLTTPLSVSQGGTGVTSSTGTGSVVLSASPALTGTPTAPTATVGTNTTQLATTAFVQSAAGTGRLLNVQVFTSSGTYTPTAGTNSVIVDVVGGGGGGGGSAAASGGNAAAGAGGGGGAYARVRLTSGFSGVTVTIGAAGSAGAAGANSGGTGGTSSFGSLVSCAGGIGGSGGSAVAATSFITPGNGAASPTISSGTTLISSGGAPGTPGIVGANIILGGVGGGSVVGNNTTMVSASGSAGASGANGSGPGSGGGGGAGGGTASAQAGGTGGAGRIIVYEYN